ncbi:MAG: hypothetical protein JST02_01290 [Bacteroidetes bacterium]|nr:hypothetical protein [Bacteroidota bacterium]
MNRFFYSVLFVTLFCWSCDHNRKQSSGADEKFDSAKWMVNTDGKFPHRDAMLNDLLANSTLQRKKRAEVLRLLGEPTREDNGYLFYLVSQEKIGFFPLHTKTLVIKFTEYKVVEWVKIHK